MLTKCTNPAAPFYEIDLAILSTLEGAGIDLQCGAIGAISVGLMGMICLAAFGIAYAAANLRAGHIRAKTNRMHLR
jgi:hypothetical protein